MHLQCFEKTDYSAYVNPTEHIGAKNFISPQTSGLGAAASSCR